MRKFLIIPVLLLTTAACTEVPVGYKGVEVSQGTLRGVRDEGLVWHGPLTNIVLMDTRQLKWESETEAYTKDVQRASLKFALTYRIDPSSVKSVYRTVGEDWPNKLVPQVVEQSIKGVFGKSEAVKDAIQNRGAIQTAIRSELIRNLRARSIIVEGFEIKDISFSDAFENAVEAKQVAVEHANAAKNKTVEIEENAKQKVITATAEAEAMRIKSAALANNPGLTQYEAVKQWNGVLPQQMMGNAIPFVQMK